MILSSFKGNEVTSYGRLGSLTQFLVMTVLSFCRIRYSTRHVAVISVNLV